MYKIANELVYSPSDLRRFMSSPFASWIGVLLHKMPRVNEYGSDETDSKMGLFHHKGALLA